MSIPEMFCRSEQCSEGLAARLKYFYATTPDYDAFQTPSNQTLLWAHLALAIRERLKVASNRKLRGLEVGSGRSGLPTYIKAQGLQEHVELFAQDVTAQNAPWLEEHFDSVIIAGIESLRGEFDAVIGSYVFEHITSPRRFLGTLVNLLAPGGCLLMTCPRYDLPFYLSRSADHLSPARRLATGCYLLWCRLLTIATGRAAWLVHRDPAVFHLPFHPDRDAVHWVSWFDIRAEWPSATKLVLGAGGFRDWVSKKLLTAGFKIPAPDRATVPC